MDGSIAQTSPRYGAKGRKCVFTACVIACLASGHVFVLWAHWKHSDAAASPQPVPAGLAVPMGATPERAKDTSTQENQLLLAVEAHHARHEYPDRERNVEH